MDHHLVNHQDAGPAHTPVASNYEAEHISNSWGFLFPTPTY